MVRSYRTALLSAIKENFLQQTRLLENVTHLCSRRKNGAKILFAAITLVVAIKRENDQEIGFHFFLRTPPPSPYFFALLGVFTIFQNGAAKYEFKSRGNKYWRSIRWKKLPSWNYFMRECYELRIRAAKIRAEKMAESIHRGLRIKRGENKNNGK